MASKPTQIWTCPCSIHPSTHPWVKRYPFGAAISPATPPTSHSSYEADESRFSSSPPSPISEEIVKTKGGWTIKLTQPLNNTMDHSPTPKVPQFPPPQPSKSKSSGDEGKNSTFPFKSAPQEVSPPILRSPLPGLAYQVASGTPDLSSKARSCSQTTAKTGDKEKCALWKLASTPPPQNSLRVAKTTKAEATELGLPLTTIISNSLDLSRTVCAYWIPPRNNSRVLVSDFGLEIEELMGLGVMKIPQTPVINTTINPHGNFQSRTSFIVLQWMLLPLRGWRISEREVGGGVDGFG